MIEDRHRHKNKQENKINNNIFAKQISHLATPGYSCQVTQSPN